MGYFEAYRERLISNNEKLLSLGYDLKKLGFIVEIRNDDKKVNSLNIYNKEKTQGVRVQFNEVPYRFSFEYDIEPSLKNGSSFTGKEFYVNDLDLPFTINDILENFKSMYIDRRFSNFTKQL